MLINIINRQKTFRINQSEILKKTTYILTSLSLPKAEVVILFTNNRYIKKLNSQYRHRNYATDVLSFPMREGKFGKLNSPMLGDIVISVEKANTNSKIHNFTLREELLFLIIHGILHLLGYNHETKDELKKLERIQNKLFNEVIT